MHFHQYPSEHKFINNTCSPNIIKHLRSFFFLNLYSCMQCWWKVMRTLLRRFKFSDLSTALANYQQMLFFVGLFPDLMALLLVHDNLASLPIQFMVFQLKSVVTAKCMTKGMMRTSKYIRRWILVVVALSQICCRHHNWERVCAPSGWSTCHPGGVSEGNQPRTKKTRRGNEAAASASPTGAIHMNNTGAATFWAGLSAGFPEFSLGFPLRGFHYWLPSHRLTATILLQYWRNARAVISTLFSLPRWIPASTPCAKTATKARLPWHPAKVSYTWDPWDALSLFHVPAPFKVLVLPYKPVPRYLKDHLSDSVVLTAPINPNSSH